jgi:hypothetical protein
LYGADLIISCACSTVTFTNPQNYLNDVGWACMIIGDNLDGPCPIFAEPRRSLIPIKPNKFKINHWYKGCISSFEMNTPQPRAIFGCSQVSGLLKAKKLHMKFVSLGQGC